MEVRSQQDAESVCIKRRHGAISAGEVLEEESLVYYLKAVALIGLRGHGRRGKRRRGELSLVAAALYKIDRGGFARTGCWRRASSLFLLGKAGYVYLLSLIRGCFHVVEIGRVPSTNNIRSVSTMTTADSAVCIFYFRD